MQWIAKQIGRIRRFAALLPRLFGSPSRISFTLRKLSRAVFFNGFEGFKAVCRETEAIARSYAAADASRQERAEVLRLPAASAPVIGYVILAPEYVGSSAGIGCLYRLCHELNARGYPSYITGSSQTNPALNAPLIGWPEAVSLCKEGYVAVYAETYAGNPLGASRVARWVLNRPGLLGGAEVYDDAELVFNYCNAYEPYIKNHVQGKLYMPTIDEEIFFCDENDRTPRSLECFYIGKSTWKDGIIDRNKVFEITRTGAGKDGIGQAAPRIARALLFRQQHDLRLRGDPLRLPRGDYPRRHAEPRGLRTARTGNGRNRLGNGRARPRTGQRVEAAQAPGKGESRTSAGTSRDSSPSPSTPHAPSRGLRPRKRPGKGETPAAPPAVARAAAAGSGGRFAPSDPRTP